MTTGLTPCVRRWIRRAALLLVPLLMLPLAACDNAQVTSASGGPEVDEARHTLDLLRARNFAPIQQNLDAVLQPVLTPEILEKMAAAFPAGEPKSVKVISVQRTDAKAVATDPARSLVNVTFEYEFPAAAATTSNSTPNAASGSNSIWLFSNVAYQTKAGSDVKTIIGLNVLPLPNSVENLNRFTLAHRTSVHYAVLALGVAIPLLILAALTACLRTPMEWKRKAAWAVFILFGIGQFSLNWTTGAWLLNPVAVLLFGVSAARPLYGAWTLSIAFPLGALLFFLWRLRRKDAALAMADSAR